MPSALVLPSSEMIKYVKVAPVIYLSLTHIKPGEFAHTNVLGQTDATAGATNGSERFDEHLLSGSDSTIW